MNWRFAYAIGFHPWEDAATDPPFAKKFSELLDREAGMDANTALRVSHYFGNKPQFWLQLQNEYDLHLARITHGSSIGRLPTINDHTGLAD